MRALVLAALLLAGCSAPAQNASSDCEARFVGERSGNLALVDAWQDAPDRILARLAEAVGDAPQGAPEAEADGLRWASARGELRWTPAPLATWAPRESPPDLGAALRAAVEAFHPPPGLAYAADGLAAWQTLEGSRIAGTGAAWENGSLRLGPLHEIDLRAPLLPAGEMAERAVSLAACVDEDAGREAQLSELRADPGGLVRRAHVASGPEGCAGALLMDFDAATGALVGAVYCGAP